MLVTSFHLLYLVYLDSSCTRDKVSGAAGRHAVGSVFCSPLIKCTVTSNLRFHYRDSYLSVSTLRDSFCLDNKRLSITFKSILLTHYPHSFCSPLIKCTVTSKLRFHYRDSFLIGFYLDETTFVHLPGLAKTATDTNS